MATKKDQSTSQLLWKEFLEDHAKRAAFYTLNPLALGGRRISYTIVASEEEAEAAEAKATRRKPAFDDFLHLGDIVLGLRVRLDPLADVSEVVLPVPKPVAVKWPKEGACSSMLFVVGGTGAGKSVFVNDTLAHDVTVRYGEPAEHYDLRENVYHAEDLLDAIYTAVYLGANGYRVTLDSLRTLVYGAKGTATEKGISSGLYTSCLNLSNFTSKAGSSVVAVVNPMTSRDAEALLFANLVASSGGGWHLVEGRPESQSYRGIDGRVFGDARAESAESEVFGSGLVVTRAPFDGPTFMRDNSRIAVDLEGADRIASISEMQPFNRDTDALSRIEERTTTDDVFVRKGTRFIAFDDDEETAPPREKAPQQGGATRVDRIVTNKRK